mgnify:CR=1 FL=1
MRFKNWLKEQTTTGSVGAVGTGAKASNTKMRIRISDKEIEKLINYLKKRNNTNVNIDGDIAEIDIPSNLDKRTMDKLSQYRVDSN